MSTTTTTTTTTTTKKKVKMIERKKTQFILEHREYTVYIMSQQPPLNSDHLPIAINLFRFHKQQPPLVKNGQQVWVTRVGV